MVWSVIWTTFRLDGISLCVIRFTFQRTRRLIAYTRNFSPNSKQLKRMLQGGVNDLKTIFAGKFEVGSFVEKPKV